MKTKKEWKNISTSLFFFLLGIFFSNFICPVLETIAELVITTFEILKAKQSLKITELNLKIQKTANNLEEQNTAVIGFSAPETISVFEDEDDEDDEDV